MGSAGEIERVAGRLTRELTVLALVCLAAISLVGSETRDLFVDSSTQIDSAISGS